ncbi:sensor histidine kinase [Rhodohalobacter sulfatireducens]|uniref:histidine kinase n=1 Tax=Rhodohalobacter sulfatireducens TaxID=2911366 RepID=A0ABS9KFJ4_9BACT|nr:HAMP domain-containing sensor histidine kinase [Rhodohalobacter sulfatireducens]MCG2589611.1 HAMP domain-containing histidine kinase [Rhodohalobacter sulfatireducens]MDR9364708.1 HAMP domain-containing sensor histidine kinase [Balneolaceae bacterium]MDR9409906.1 HAMP domain-containing sensor histidine kinase [Balneolaceae bacterium]
MKLITRFILIYLTITVIVLGIGGVFSYFIIKGEVDRELTFEFMERIDRVTYLLERGRRFHPGRDVDGDRNLIVRELDTPVEERVEVGDTLIYSERLEQNEQNVKVSAYRNINDRSYYISTYGAMIEPDDITEAVIKTLLWILGLQIIGAIGVGFMVSGRLFKPFRKTLEKIGNFQLHKKEYVPAEKTGVKEFNDLNKFVEQMTRKAVSDYKNLKEFAENASHELQTPLAIAKGKLELLSETDLTEEQYKYIESLERSVKKLSRLSESLALLTKIENHEFQNDEKVDLSDVVRESLEAFKEFIALNNLTVQTNIQDDVQINMHPILADILWTNLFQNAVRHNIENGEINIELNGEKLVISNTGKDPEVDPGQLFERFRKAEQSSESIGLGLSIIKRIVDQNDLSIHYSYSDNWHRIEIDLK